MINFWNDHLVAPELCEIIYQLVPIEYHQPVVFNAKVQDWRNRGTWNPQLIRINLQTIFYSNITAFDYWKQLLLTAFHEFGHAATSMYNIEQYNNSWDYKWQEERRADSWADRRMVELLRYDKRLAQPERLGAYFNGRIVQIKNRRTEPDGINMWSIREWRKYKSGGQFTTNEVAWYQGIYAARNGVPATWLIRKLAEDLAYIYFDKAGRKHMLFAYGDLEEIARRVQRYKAEHNWTASPYETYVPSDLDPF